VIDRYLELEPLGSVKIFLLFQICFKYVFV
jgi:hypothetical protein